MKYRLFVMPSKMNVELVVVEPSAIDRVENLRKDKAVEHERLHNGVLRSRVTRVSQNL